MDKERSKPSILAPLARRLSVMRRITTTRPTEKLRMVFNIYLQSLLCFFFRYRLHSQRWYSANASKPYIVSSAMRLNGPFYFGKHYLPYYVIPSARHWDIMSHHSSAMFKAALVAGKVRTTNRKFINLRMAFACAEQGFVDQHGRFYSRKRAMRVMKLTGQWEMRRGYLDDYGEAAYSEHLY
uniref:Uncharacterized protein s009 n=1 Tax=Vibrio cholerae TaxID=666 RepID=Q8VVN5_VIBCL|nr:hypothetical protein [Vibrio cholerae MO10]AAL59743.1 unknown [Vibrio cholerae]